MRVACVACSAAEIEAVRNRLAVPCIPVDGRVAAREFDLAIVGSAALACGTIPEAVVGQIETPAIAILPDGSGYANYRGPLPAVALGDDHRLPLVVREQMHLSDVIRARLRAEEKLAAREAQLSFAQELSRTGSWEWDPVTGLTTVSPETRRLLGVDETDLTMEQWLALVHPDDRELARSTLAEAAAGEVPVEGRVRMRRGDGTMIHVHGRAQRVSRGGNRGPSVVGIVQDVSAEVQTEESLRESEARYRTLVEQAKDIIVSIDLEGRVQSLNRAFEELTGWSRIEWIGRSFFQVLDEDCVALAAERFRALLAGEAFAAPTEYRLRKRDGGSLTVEGVGRSVKSDGRIVSIVVVARDVTARNEAAARAEKEKRLASLGQLATSVAHEFNNVLMSIMPFTELLQRRFSEDASVMTATQHMMRAIRRGREISQEILRFARPVTPALEPVVASAWVEEFYRKALAILGPRYAVTVDLPGEEVAMLADRTLLDQAATNIALNAREAMPGGGTFRISVTADHDTVSIGFADSGCGIASNLLDRIFEPLYTTKRGGNGLGLSVAHQVITQQNGTISVRSKVGEGSTFIVALRRTELPLQKSGESSLEQHRVLIVEDDQSVGEGLRALLLDAGFDVKLVDRGGATIAAVEIFEPEVVLLDVNLPDMSGLEVFDQVQTRWPALPVIFSTGHADARALADVRNRRVPAIMKPYDLGELMELMERVRSRSPGGSTPRGGPSLRPM